MSPILPILQKDQTLDSFIEATARVNGLDWRTTGLVLFGSKNVKRGALVHRGLSHFADMLLLQSKKSPEEVAAQHGWLEFFMPFLDEVTRNHARSLQVSDTPGGVTSAVGLGPDVFKPNTYFCPECSREEISRLGYAYAHRTHQVVGVHTCPKHGAPLKSAQDIGTEVNTGGVLTKKGLRCSAGTYEKNKTPHSEAISKFPRWVEAAYLQRIPPSDERLRIEIISDRLAKLPCEKGLPRSFANRVSRLLRCSYGDEFLDEIGLSLNNGSSAWPRLFFVQYSHSNHPLANLAILNLLFSSPEEYAAELGQKVVDVEQSYLPAKQSKKNPKIVWSVELIKALVSGQSTFSISRTFDIDIYAIRRYLRLDTALAAHRVAASKRWKTRRSRKKVTSYVNLHPRCSRSELYDLKQYKQEMVWLVNHDPVWLEALIPPIPAFKKKNREP